MNIKKILLPLLFTLSGYSFNAFALSTVTFATAGAAQCGISPGIVINPSGAAPCMVGKQYPLPSGRIIVYTSVASISSSKISMNYRRNDGRTGREDAVLMSSGGSCSGPIDPDTGTCSPPPPPFCSSSVVEQLRNENKASCAAQGGSYSEECDNEKESYVPSCDVPPPPLNKFCDSDAVSSMKSEGLKSCTAQGGSYSFQCNNDTESFTDSCDNIPPEPPEPPPECVPSADNNWCDNPPPDKCVIGSPSWPQCEPWYDEDPTSPLDPVNPPKPDPINPSVPKPVDPTPSPSPNPDGSFNDRGVIRAINDLNLDMNFGFSDINNALQLQTNILSNNNELIVHGLQQDLEIYENNKKLLLNNTESIVNAIGSIPTPKTYDDSGVIDAINGISNGKGYDDSKVIDQLQGINDKLENQTEPCIPSEENGYCEGPNGLTAEYIAEMFGQLNDRMDSELSAADTSILGAAKDLVTKPPVEKSTVEPFAELGISILTGNDNCVPMDWFGFDLTCEFSDKFKSIFGFVLYIWTLFVLKDILLEEITPHQKSYGHRRR